MSQDRWPAMLSGVIGLFLLLLISSVITAGEPTARLIVVFYPDGNDGRPGSQEVDRAIRDTFAANSLEAVEIHSEYLDRVRFPDEAYQQHLAAFLKRKYAGRKIDLVIVGLAPALDFALRYRTNLFPGVPVVFCAIEKGEVLARKLPADVIGVPIQMELAATLDLALRLQPDTQKVFVVSGLSKFDQHWTAEARRIFQRYQPTIEFNYLTGLPLPELLDRVGQLPERSILYYLHVFTDHTGKLYVPAEVAHQVATAANVPVYGHVNTYVGRGVVGGRVFRFATTGKEAAELGLRVLAGEKPETIPVAATSESVDLFDWRQLRRWGIAEDRLPPTSVVLFREPTFWDQYRWQILAGVTVCLVQTLLIVGLLLQRASRRRAEKRFRQVVEADPCGMVLIDRNGLIVLANPHIGILFGYTTAELIGQPVEILLPERFRDQHVRHRTTFFDAPQTRPMGVNAGLSGRHKDGREFPIEVGLNPVRLDLGLFVLASVVDITERQKVLDSLRESQAELHTLTGRLLQARETERRHLARELHDDLNQRLALLAVELDLLSQEPPGSVDEMGDRARVLAAQVKRLSSDVHDLSHQLHPAKLAQLGLLAAVRGLCAELARSHALLIDFSHHDVPVAIAEDVALCLYRIAQEALQNVIKHSGARHAEVVVSGSDEAIVMRVADDGHGFDPDAVEQHGRLGLISMRERLRLVGGTLAIDTRPGEGTQLLVRVPLGP